MMKRALILFVSILFTATLQAKEGIRITPFTGTDYVRVLVDAGFKTAPSNTFRALIRSKNDGKILWQGPVNLAAQNTQGKNNLTFTIKGLKPQLWTIAAPNLYEITLQQFAGTKLKGQLQERLGFRSITTQNGQIIMNGKPVFLRGIAINPPNRGIPKKLEESRQFALDYVTYMKSINVNIIRIPDAEEWYDVCDELGMMVFGGNYSGAINGEKPPKDYDKAIAWYENDKFGAIAHHPSLLVYAMTNETPFQGRQVAEWEKFLSYAADKLKQWDETRIYIANAGYGYGKAGDICDLHRYWGWYYSSPYTFLHIRNKNEIIPFVNKPQPITFTECVGNYTGPDGRYNLTPQHKNPSSQLAWTGHERQDLQARLADEHQSNTLRNATELFRQLRVVNTELSGVFPFTILFYNWDTVNSFADMNPKPVTDQVKISYQPVLLSWECWTAQIYAGATIKPVAHIINDDNEFKDLRQVKLSYTIYDKAKQAVFADSMAMADIPYYATADKTLSVKLPENLISGQYKLIGQVTANGKKVSENFFNLFIADKNYATTPVLASSVLLYDKQGKTKAALQKLNIGFKEVAALDQAMPANSVLIIGENAADDSFKQNAANVKGLVQKGGRVLCLRQDSAHRTNLNAVLDYKLTNITVDIDNPVYPVSNRAPRNGYYVNPERTDHPVFAGINRENLKVWSDYTNWNEKLKGFPAILPVTDGFTLEDKDGVANTAILANYSSGLQGIALGEQFIGSGSILLCGLDLANRAGLDPIADRMLLNLVDYTASPAGHERYALITAPIIWGEYETEKGVVTDIYSGFLVNSTPRIPADYRGKGIKVTKEGYQLAGGLNLGFNDRPGIQYVANGRRPFGPYTHSFGGQPRLGADSSSHGGTGKFWCRIPQGQNMASSVVWNPSKEPLDIKIQVNSLPEVTKTVKPGDRITIDCPVNSNIVGMTYMGDRRLVVLATTFKHSN
jgi:beta-galactosidase